MENEQIEKDCSYCEHYRNGYCFREPTFRHVEITKRSNWLLQLILGDNFETKPGGRLPPQRCCCKFSLDEIKYRLLKPLEEAWLFGTKKLDKDKEERLKYCSGGLFNQIKTVGEHGKD